MVQLFRAAPQFFRQIGPTVSDELQIAEIQLVEKGATVSHQFMSSSEALISRLSFSHIRELLTIDDPLIRYFYEQECMRCTWSVRELRRQIGTNLHIRVGLKPQDVVTESDLEDALIKHLQEFLLEFGKGMCFEARQQRIIIDDEYSINVCF